MESKPWSKMYDTSSKRPKSGDKFRLKGLLGGDLSRSRSSSGKGLKCKDSIKFQFFRG